MPVLAQVKKNTSCQNNIIILQTSFGRETKEQEPRGIELIQEIMKLRWVPSPLYMPPQILHLEVTLIFIIRKNYF